MDAEDEVPVKVVKKIVATPRVIMEEFIAEKYGKNVPKDVTVESMYGLGELDKQENYPEHFDCFNKIECRECFKIPELDEEIEIWYIASPDTDHLLEIPFHKRCVPFS